MKREILLCIVILLYCFSCKNSQKENESLYIEIENLKTLLAECRLSPAELLQQANEYYDGQNLKASKTKLLSLLTKYPNANESTKARILLKKVNDEIIKRKNQFSPLSGKRLQRILEEMVKKHDILSATDWYYDKSSSQDKTENLLFAYVGQKKRTVPQLHYTINHYTKNDWLFIEHIIIDADGKIYNLEEQKLGMFETSEVSGGMREWFNKRCSSNEIKMLHDIATSSKTKIRYIGKRRMDERVVSSSEKESLQRILGLYESLGGKLEGTIIP
ncbi:hypothetical protein ACE939_09970 [Aquimarina sp. W85]|uniref:hypothetical protein n=1 Tax=Aquimarina rhodophyticola TaxID=3342246 RepID=UPI00366B36AF